MTVRGFLHPEFHSGTEPKHTIMVVQFSVTAGLYLWGELNNSSHYYFSTTLVK